MRIASLLSFMAGGVTLAAAGFAYGLPELGIVGLVLAALSPVVLGFGRMPLVHGLFALNALSAGAIGLFHLPPVLCAGVVAAALIGWDTHRGAPSVAKAPQGARRWFARTYAIRAAAVTGLGVLLVGAAGTVRIPLTFGTGLALSFAVLVLAALFLRSLRRAALKENSARSDRE